MPRSRSSWPAQRPSRGRRRHRRPGGRHPRACWSAEWQGDILYGRNEAVGGHYILAYVEAAGASAPPTMRPCRAHAPLARQLSSGRRTAVLPARLRAVLRAAGPARRRRDGPAASCLPFRRRPGLYMHPASGADACSPLAGRQRFLRQAGGGARPRLGGLRPRVRLPARSADRELSDSSRTEEPAWPRTRVRLPPLPRRVRHLRHHLPAVADGEPGADPGRGAAPPALRPLVRHVRLAAGGGRAAAGLLLREGLVRSTSPIRSSTPSSRCSCWSGSSRSIPRSGSSSGRTARRRGAGRCRPKSLGGS